MLDTTTTNYIPRKHRRCGIAILLCLNGDAKEESAEMTAGLHKRFTEPQPCEKKEDLFLALTSWSRDLDELSEKPVSRPSRETVLLSLRTLTSKVQGLRGSRATSSSGSSQRRGNGHPSAMRRG